MYILVDNESLYVCYVGLTRDQMLENKKDYMAFMEDSAYEMDVTLEMRFNRENSIFEEMTEQDIKLQKRRLLQKTDWKVVSDYPYEDQEDWMSYRNELRNMTTTFPTIPGKL